MLLILMFHRVSDPTDASVLERFERFIIELERRHPLVLPGDPLLPGELSVCLTFDDAYCDYYLSAFPLLRARGIKSVLAVPTKYIIEDTQRELEERMVPLTDRLQAGETYDRELLCTWRELKELQASGLVSVASHGHSHTSLRGTVDLETELVHSRDLLAAKLEAHVDTFVYPFGHFDSAVQREARSTYDYIMRIGSALNFGWGGSRRLLYRVNADPFWLEDRGLDRIRLVGYGLNWLNNRLRNR